MTPLKAIRAKCMDCCCESAYEVRMCPCSDCPLYPYRFGKNPRRMQTGEGDIPPESILSEKTPSQFAIQRQTHFARVNVPPDTENEKEALFCAPASITEKGS